MLSVPTNQVSGTWYVFTVRKEVQKAHISAQDIGLPRLNRSFEDKKQPHTPCVENKFTLEYTMADGNAWGMPWHPMYSLYTAARARRSVPLP